MVVQTFTLEEFQSYMQNLPKKLQQSSENINKEMAESLVRRIKFNLHEVSKSSTGNLRNSIKANTTAKNRISVTGARYWQFLNEGRFPKSIPAQFIQQHMANPGIKGQRVNNPIWVRPENRTNEGFVNKSIDSLKEDTNKIIERGLNKAFRK